MDPYHVHLRPDGPVPTDLHPPSQGPESSFSAWWYQHGTYVREYERRSMEYMRELYQSLSAMEHDYRSGDHQKKGFHCSIYLARLTNIGQRLRLFQDHNTQMDALLARSWVMHHIDTQEVMTGIKLYERTQRCHSLLTDVLSSISRVTAQPYSCTSNYVSIFPVVQSSIADIGAFLRET